MPYPWFKFFGGDYLHDEKFLGMDGHVRSCWLTLLCYAASAENQGTVRYLTEDQLMIQAGVPMGGEEWERTRGVLDTFERRGMITSDENGIHVINWQKRQDSYASEAERSRKRRSNGSNPVARPEKVTLEEEVEEEVDKKEKEHTRRDWLTAIPDPSLRELSEKYEASPGQITRKAEELHNYCLAKGKTYKNYRAFLENALNRDFGRRLQRPAPEKIERRPLTDDELAALERVKASMKFTGV